MHAEFLSENMKAEDPGQRPRSIVYVKILLKFVLSKQELRTLSGFTRLRVGSSGDHV
jgi:hypothetical protein